MSHFSDIKTEIKNQVALVKALERLGLKTETHDVPQKLHDYYKGEKQAHVIVRKEYTGIPSDIGFEKVNGYFVAHVDEYQYHGRPCYNKEWQSKLTAYYGCELAKAELKSKGLSYIEEIDEKNQEPRLRVML
jgi:hypothetical protein